VTTTYDLTVVLPAYNEHEILASTVRAIVSGLRSRQLTFEVIVVENGSTDDTLAIGRQLERLHREVRVEHRDAADYGAALRHGLLEAQGDFVANFDCDYYDLEFLDRALQRLHANDALAVVVASKRGEGARDERAWPRRLVTAVFATILSKGFGLHVSDTHGMKVLRRAAVESHARASTLGRDLFDTELILRAERAGLATGEVPVAVHELRPARTSIARRVPRTLVGLARLRWALR
jgi:glycosyltransferase involved in cell wall biosynthesis